MQPGAGPHLPSHRRGREAFYHGPPAGAFVAAGRKDEGRIEAADPAEFEPEWVEPISTTYRGGRVSELPPNGQGLAVLRMLNIMEPLPAPAAGPFSAEALHGKIEPMKLACADLMACNAGPRQARLARAGLLSKEYAKQRAALIGCKGIRCETPAGRASPTRPISPWPRPKATSSAGSSASAPPGAEAFLPEAPAFCGRIAEATSDEGPAIRRDGSPESGVFRQCFPGFWKRTVSSWPSASSVGQAAAGSRAVRLPHRQLRAETAGGARSAPLPRGRTAGLRREAGGAHRPRRRGSAARPRPPGGDAARLSGEHGPRRRRRHGPRQAGEIRRRRSPRRRPRRPVVGRPPQTPQQ